MAIIIGDTIGALGNRILFESEFKPERVIHALRKLQDIVALTCVGEMEDVLIENKGRATEKEILQMYKNKTAKYTVEGPLHLGAILGGADEKLLNNLSEYSIPVGIAFQIQDDILGIFGNEEKMGKSVGSDVMQGKQTLLVAKAYAKATGARKKILDRTLGKKDLTSAELESFRKVILETGSLDYAKDMAIELVSKGKDSLNRPGSKIKKESEDFLLGIADYIISRVI